MVSLASGPRPISTASVPTRRIDEFEYRVSAIIGYAAVAGCGVGLALLFF